MAATLDRIKLVVVGDPGVGKSSFVHGVVNQTPLVHASSTIGCNVEVLAYTYNGEKGRSRDVFLEFWEVAATAGQRVSRSIFYSNPNGLILVHDLSNRKSFLNLSKWLREVLNSGKQELTGVTVRGTHDSQKYNNSYEDEDKNLFNNIGSLPILVLGTKESIMKICDVPQGKGTSQDADVRNQDQCSKNQSVNRSGRLIGLNDESDVFFCDMNSLQESQLLYTSNKWNDLNAFLEKVVENRFYPSGRNFSQKKGTSQDVDVKNQESEFWRGRKKVF